MVMNRFLLITLGILVMGFGFYFDPGHARSSNLIKMRIPGDSRDYKGFHYSKDIETLGKFAVQEHNKKQNALLEFVRVLKAKEQVVAGKLYYLTLEAIDAGHKKTFQAKIWVKPWMNFKQLQEFKHAGGGLSFTPSDLAVRLGNGLI